MSKFTELTQKLKEIFQIDRSDLDFGVYRILNKRSQEIADYLDNRLPRKVREVLGANKNEQLAGWQAELEQKQKQLQELGVVPESSLPVQELKGKIERALAGNAGDEQAVYRHLLTFFSRYYEDGDFISQRRYKGNTYAIPYSGEEVMLYWANKDQYYTKSSENFSNYRFKLEDGREVLFRLMAADTAKDNRKDNDAKRLFALLEPYCVEKVDDKGELYTEKVARFVESADKKQLEIRFVYQLVGKGEKQEQYNQATLTCLKEVLSDDWSELWQVMPTEKNPNRTLLEKHLSDYTKKNTADYFIHKDLGGFLRSELDFYIKNEVMHLDDVQAATQFATLEHSLRQIQTIRAIAHDIIDFLAQLENFQKKLWLKKKFVVGSHYLITLDRVLTCYQHIGEESKSKIEMLNALMAEIFGNAKQITQWQEWFDFDMQTIDLKAFTPPP